MGSTESSIIIIERESSRISAALSTAYTLWDTSSIPLRRPALQPPRCTICQLTQLKSGSTATAQLTFNFLNPPRDCILETPHWEVPDTSFCADWPIRHLGTIVRGMDTCRINVCPTAMSNPLPWGAQGVHLGKDMSPTDAEDAFSSAEHSGDEDDITDEKVPRVEGDAPPPQASSSQKLSSNAKDPSRPGKKKARIACLACRRARLTCDDERPCQRCIVRNLQDACQDGVRKAKYLQDAPPKALMPDVGAHYQRPPNGSQTQVYLPNTVPVPNATVALTQHANFYSQRETGSYDTYPQTSNKGLLSPPVQDGSAIDSLGNQRTPISSPYTQHGANQSTPQAASSTPQVSQASAQKLLGFGEVLFDPSDPALLNFDIANLNFGSHYGALEFGMLVHISGAAADSPPNDGTLMNSLNKKACAFQPPGGTPSPLTDGSTHIPTAVPFEPDTISERQNVPQSRQNSAAQIHTPQSTPIPANLDGTVRDDSFPGPSVSALGAGLGSLSSASPASTVQDIYATYKQGSVSPAFFVNTNQQPAQHLPIYTQQPQTRANSTLALQPVNPNVGPHKRRRDTRVIYEDLKQPYSYTQAFHRLQKLLQQRLPFSKVVRVAKAMATIRPTFIACMKDLDEQDLIQQERTFQRKLWSYQDWIESMGTPTLIIRRSGEVAAVGKEFCMLSGWRMGVLLGKEPNLNVNRDSSPGRNSGASSRGILGTPRIPTEEEAIRPQPVFLAELLDSESVVQFYEDFARLAFGDARGAVERRCRVMKYRTKLEGDSAAKTTCNIPQREESARRKKQKTKHPMKVDPSDSAPARGQMRKLQGGRMEKNSVECMMGWMCWHDQFDMPAMIVMNFLPILHPTPAEPERIRAGPPLPPR